jgi:hypothetical protein
MAGLKVKIFGHPAIAVSVVIETDHVAAGAELAGVVLASNAVVATVTREEERERHSIALFERSTKGVGIDAIAQRVNNASEFVTKYSTLR